MNDIRHFKGDEVVRRVVQSRLGGRVKRCHNVPHHGHYDVANHTWGALVILWHVYPEYWIKLSPVLLAHDIGEGWIGDVPAPSMRYVPGLREQIGKLEAALVADLGFPTDQELTPEEYAVYKAVDRLELYFWCVEQLLGGNRYAHDVMEELAAYLHENPPPGNGFLFFERLRTADLTSRQAGVVKEVVERS